MSLEWLGIGATLPVGVFILRYGLRMGALLGLLLPTSAHLLIWSACANEDYYIQHYPLLAVYFFLAGENHACLFILFGFGARSTDNVVNMVHHKLSDRHIIFILFFLTRLDHLQYPCEDPSYIC